MTKMPPQAHGESSCQPHHHHHRMVKMNKSNGQSTSSKNRSSFLPAMHTFAGEESYRTPLLYEQTLQYIPTTMQHSVIPPTQGEEDHTPPSFKSPSIPIHKSVMKRTPSELKLREDQELADYRDYVMFRRIVDRLTKQQQEIQDHRLRKENDICLAHAIGIRNGSEDNDSTNNSNNNNQQRRQQQQHERAIHKRYILSDFAPPRQALPPPPSSSFATALLPNLQQQEDDDDEMFELEL